MKRLLPWLIGIVPLLILGFLFLPSRERGLDSAPLAQRARDAESEDPSPRFSDRSERRGVSRVLPHEAPRGESILNEGEPEIDPAAGAHLSVAVRWKSDGGPVARTRVEVLLGEGSAARTKRLEVETDDNGDLELSSLPPGKVVLHAFLGGWLEGELKRGEETHLELVIEDGLFIDGFVLDDRGVPVGGASIFFASEGFPNVGAFVARTSSDGTFHLRTATRQALIGAVAEGYEPSEHVLVEGSAFERREVRLTLPRGGASIQGRVFSAAGRPVPNAHLTFSTGARRLSEREDGTYAGKAVRFLATTDDEGHYEVPSIQPGEVGLACLAHGHAALFRVFTLERSGPTELDLRLAEESLLEGIVRDASGKPLEGAWVHVVPSSREGTNLEESHRFVVASDARGSYRLEGLPAGEVKVRVEAPSDGALEDVIDLREGELTRWDARLPARGTFAGVLVDERGAPLPGWSVRASSSRTMGDYRGASDTVSAEGRFEIRGLLPISHRLSVFPEEGYGYEAFALPDLEPSRTDLVLTVPDSARSGAVLRGEVRDARGVAVRGAELTLRRAGTRGGRIFRVDEFGGFELGPLPGGTYALEVEATGFAPWRRAEIELVPARTFDLSVITLVTGGRIEVALESPTEEAVDVSIHREGSWLQAIDLTNGRGTSRPLAPGIYEVRILGEHVRMHVSSVEVRDGETATCTLPVEPGRSFLVGFSAPLSTDGPETIDCAIRRGREFVERRTCRMHPQVFARDLEKEERTGRHPIGTALFSLPLGSYVVEVSSGAWRAERAITLSGGEEEVEVWFELPGL